MKQRLNLEELKKRLDTPSNKIFLMIQQMYDILESFDKIDVKIKPMLANYLIIRSVSLIESYFKNKVRELIDKSNFNADEIQKTSEITKGRIISYMINYQNLSQIDSIMSKLLQIDGFLNILNNTPSSYIFTLGEEVSFEFKRIKDLFELRHKLVHEAYQIPDSEYDELRAYYANAVMFIGNASVMIDIHKSKFTKKPKN